MAEIGELLDRALYIVEHTACDYEKCDGECEKCGEVMRNIETLKNCTIEVKGE